MTSFDPDFFEREEITAIGGEFGPLGELAAIRLLCEVCRRGYYMPWDTIRKMSIIGKIPGLTPPAHGVSPHGRTCSSTSPPNSA